MLPPGKLKSSMNTDSTDKETELSAKEKPSSVNDEDRVGRETK